MEHLVVHNVESNRFELQLEDGQLARLDYYVAEEGLDFAHTYVPEAFEGRGIAAALVRTGLDYAREHALQVIPSCPYVAAYIKRHPEYMDLVKRNDHD